jgi:hypothetical protein
MGKLVEQALQVALDGLTVTITMTVSRKSSAD